jgi:hypothetical protein
MHAYIRKCPPPKKKKYGRILKKIGERTGIRKKRRRKRKHQRKWKVKITANRSHGKTEYGSAKIPSESTKKYADSAIMISDLGLANNSLTAGQNVFRFSKYNCLCQNVLSLSQNVL